MTMGALSAFLRNSLAGQTVDIPPWPGNYGGP